MSRYAIKDPKCEGCLKPLKGERALMIRWVRFRDQTSEESGQHSYGIPRDKVRYSFNNQHYLLCAGCTVIFAKSIERET
jgi:hypothetical protein